MIIYIAGPMSGHTQNNYPAFWLAANKFRAHGLTVLNPAELPILPDWQAYMRASLAMVAKATHIHFLPGADTSRGALIESFIAKELGIEIIGHPCTHAPSCPAISATAMQRTTAPNTTTQPNAAHAKQFTTSAAGISSKKTLMHAAMMTSSHY